MKGLKEITYQNYNNINKRGIKNKVILLNLSLKN